MKQEGESLVKQFLNDDWNVYLYGTGRSYHSFMLNAMHRDSDNKWDFTHVGTYPSKVAGLASYEDYLVRQGLARWVPSAAGQGNSATSSAYHFVTEPNHADVPTAERGANDDLIGTW